MLACCVGPGPGPQRQYLCRRRESEGHLSGGRVCITAHVSERGDRTTEEKSRSHHFYNREAIRPSQHDNTHASASLSAQAVRQTVTAKSIGGENKDTVKLSRGISREPRGLWGM